MLIRGVRAALINNSISAPQAFTPSSISSLVAWWDADNGVTAATNKVSSWVDRKNSLALVQATDANKPTTTTSGGKNVLAFASASSQILSVAHNAVLNLADSFSIFLYCYQTGSFVDGVLLTKGLNTPAPKFAGTGHLRVDKDQVLVLMATTTSPDTALHRYVITKNGASMNIYQDEVDVSGTLNNATCANNASALQVGSDGTTPLNGGIRAILMFNAPITGTDRSNLAAYYP